MRVAVVDDDPNHLALTRSLLERMRHDCLPYLDGRSFVSAVKPEAFDRMRALATSIESADLASFEAAVDAAHATLRAGAPC